MGRRNNIFKKKKSSTKKIATNEKTATNKNIVTNENIITSQNLNEGKNLMFSYNPETKEKHSPFAVEKKEKKASKFWKFIQTVELFLSIISAITVIVAFVEAKSLIHKNKMEELKSEIQTNITLIEEEFPLLYDKSQNDKTNKFYSKYQMQIEDYIRNYNWLQTRENIIQFKDDREYIVSVMKDFMQNLLELTKCSQVIYEDFKSLIIEESCLYFKWCKSQKGEMPTFSFDNIDKGTMLTINKLTERDNNKYEGIIKDIEKYQQKNDVKEIAKIINDIQDDEDLYKKIKIQTKYYLSIIKAIKENHKLISTSEIVDNDSISQFEPIL